MIGKLARTVLGPNYYDELKHFFNKLSRNNKQSLLYDHLTKLVMKQCLRAESICVDVGCHQGHILQMMQYYAPRGEFYAFEPLPNLYAELLRSYTAPNVKLFNIALSNRKGISTFNYVVSRPAYSGFMRRRYDRDEEDRTITVRTDMLDNIISDAFPVSLIKIDVEGAELQVLEGARNLIKKHRPIIIFEHGLGAADIYGTRPEHVYDMLCTDCGMRISLLDSWLANRRPLLREEFRDQFDNRLNYYFVAHPDPEQPRSTHSV